MNLSPESDSPRTLVWTDTSRLGLTRAILEQADADTVISGVGGPPMASVDELAQEVGCPRGDDLRRLLVEDTPDVVLLFTLQGVAREDLAGAVEQGLVVMVTEPIAAEFDDLASINPRAIRRRVAAAQVGSDPVASTSGLTDPPPPPDTSAGRFVWGLAFERSPGWASAADPLELLGPAQLVSYTCQGGQEEASLYARVHDGWRVVLDLCGLPEKIDASLTGPLAEVPTNPRGLTGHFAAHARFANNTAAVVEASDRSGSWHRRLEISADKGFLRVGDDGYRLFDSGGKSMDEQTVPDPRGDSVSPLIARHWRWLIEHPHGDPSQKRPPPDQQILACCLASLLSARTGAPESPGKMLDLYGG